MRSAAASVSSTTAFLLRGAAAALAIASAIASKLPRMATAPARGHGRALLGTLRG